MGARVTHYIPSRFDEGYGLNKAAVAKIAANGAKMLITVDCGITSAEEVRFAKLLGLDVIVTDHHTPDATLPDCLILNPKVPESGYPEAVLCGAGVAFKLAQALEIRSNERGARGNLIPLARKDLLAVMDYAAIATVGDIVPLTGENRTIVKHGIRILNRAERPFVNALRAVARLADPLNGESIAFGIVPRLNAAGRIGSAEDALLLLTARTAEEALARAETLEAANTNRKQLQEETFDRSLELVPPDVPPVLFLLDPAAHEGILGIAAGKLKDRFNRPVVLFTEAKSGMYKGSGRSPEGIDLHELLAKAKHLYAHFGGHKSACGLTIPKENFEEVRTLIGGECRILYDRCPERFLPTLAIDWVLSPGDVTLELATDIERMSPFGAENPEPVFCLKNVVPTDVAFMGTEDRHVRFRADGVPCVLFRVTEDQKKLLLSGAPLSIAGLPAKNVWKDRVSVQFRVADIEG
jgi:single-stranded-DNA-specific exonuclease